jgi:hypothetical protein
VQFNVIQPCLTFAANFDAAYKAFFGYRGTIDQGFYKQIYQLFPSVPKDAFFLMEQLVYVEGKK